MGRRAPPATAAGLMRIATERLVLRTWADAHRAPFAAMSCDPEVMAYLTPMPTQALSDAWIDRQIAAQLADGFCFWAVEHCAVFVGSVGLRRVGYDAPFTPAVEIGWRIARAYWGRGFGREAATAALHFGFLTVVLAEVVANTVGANVASRRLMAAVGMLRDPAGDFDHPLIPEGSPLRRQMLYRLTRAHYLNRART